MKILLPLIAAAIGTPLLAQTITPSATPPPAAAAATPSLVPDIHSKTILETLIAAGPVMLVLFALSVFFVMLLIVYLMTIRRGAVVSSGYMATADALLRKRDYLGLLAVSNRHGEAIARVVQKMLDFTTKNPHADFQQVREIAETEGTRVAASLNNRVIYLADIGMIAPLLDVLLLLLIFFLLTWNAARTENELDVKVPKASAAKEKSAPIGDVVVNVKADGNVVVNRRTLSGPELTELLKNLVQLNSEQAVVIRGDEAGAYKNIISVLNVCTEAGITNVAFATAK